jgi:hypothetical protein
MLNQKNTFKISPLMGLIMVILFSILAYMMVKGLFALASWAMPVLAIATLIIDYKVYVTFGKFLIDLLKKNIIMGLVGVAMTFIAFPFVILYLFSKAVIKKYAMKSIKENPFFQEKTVNDDGYLNNGDYIEYEEVDDEPGNTPIIELPPVQQKMKKEEENPFDDYFK